MVRRIYFFIVYASFTGDNWLVNCSYCHLVCSGYERRFEEGLKKAIVGTLGGFFGGNVVPESATWALITLSGLVVVAGFFI